MTAWQAALWGAFGGLAVEMVEFGRVLRQTREWPWNIDGEASAGMLFVSILIRVGLGVGVAVAGCETGEIAGPFAAIGAGVAAPLLIEQLGKNAGGNANP